LPNEASPFTPVDGGVRLSVRLSPNASRTQIDGTFIDVNGDRVVKVQVASVPEHGKANKALIKLLSKQWKIPKSAITIVGGLKDRNKNLMINGEPAALLEKLNYGSETGND